MIIEKNVNDGILSIKPIGRLDSATAGEFEGAINASLTGDVNALVIDMSEVDFISSKGLRVLVSAYRKMSGKRIELDNVNQSVAEVLKLSGLMKVFTVNPA